ncbi:hypothetical protein GGQ73_004267 [Rhizobium skierniewicense]|uniref:Uncharacterized protein n=1 Tax=Rhizobium skierniewicense TaxID=984260 RepID=A0A7W6G587_9HYPH|nr:hypothetical protein [Rhizobium skierniewicense]
MAYDWSGGRVRQFRRLKLAMVVGTVFLVVLLVGQFWSS